MKTAALLLALAACSAQAATPATPANPHTGMPAASPHEIALTQHGTVLSTINVPMYTYVEVDLGKKKIWLATSTIPVKKGDTIRFDDGMVMNNFYSKTLKRTFSSIVFVNHAAVAKR